MKGERLNPNAEGKEMQKFTKAQKGKYLVMLFDEGKLDVIKDSELFGYLTACGFEAEYVGCYGGHYTFRFYAHQKNGEDCMSSC